MRTLMDTLIDLLGASADEDAEVEKASETARPGASNPPPAASSTISEPEPASPPPAVTAHQADNLRRIFAKRDPTQAGSIHLLGLESLRDKLGTRWQVVADRVHQLAEKLLKQHLAPADVWFRYGGESYVVVFATLGPQQAQLVCAKIVEELQTMLLGSADLESITVRTATYELGSDVVFAPTRLKDMLDGAALGLGPGAAGMVSSPGVPAGSTARETMAPVEVKFRPVWDAGPQVLSIYIARSYRPRPGRQPLWGYEALQDPADPQQILEMDLLILKHALDTSLELYDNRFRFFLSVPINFESLAVLARRQQMVAALQKIPTHMRAFMTYHLVGVPAGVPVSRLGEMVSTLRPYGRTIMVVVDLGSSDLPTIAASGAKVAAVALPPGTQADKIRAEMLRFAATAARHQLYTSVEGVNDPALEQLCAEAKISFLSGDLVGGWVDVPENVLRMSRDDLRHKH